MDPLPTGIHRFLISTTSQFTGVYESPALRIDHARPSADSHHSIRQGLEEGPYSRNYFALSVNIGEPERTTILIPNYRYVGDQVCAVLSILFGKRFDNHGFLVSHGMFHVPEFNNLGLPTNYFRAAPYSHQPRNDIGIPLELDRFASVAPLFTDENRDEEFIRILFAAGRFYLRSLQIFDQEPEFAYLDLVTCGETLANYYEYPFDRLLDENTKNSFERIRTEIQDGDQIVNQLSKNLHQIRRKYTCTLMRLLTTAFFAGSECTEESGRLKRDDIERRLKASYDLRSSYLHTGISFGNWMLPYGSLLNEVQPGKPDVKDKELAKAISLAPTYFGMERIMRYCLLRFIHMNGAPIDTLLNGVPLNVEEAESAAVSSEASKV